MSRLSLISLTPLVLAALVVGLGAPSLFAAPVCTDADGDGFFREGGPCHTAVDCNDADPRVYPGAAETCDAIDNDCDGRPDDTPACQRPCSDPFVDGDPRLIGARLPCGVERADAAWTGSFIAAAWNRAPCARFDVARIDPFGVPLGPETPLPQPSAEGATPVVNWTGSEIGVAWSDLRANVYLSRLDSSGGILAGPTVIAGYPDGGTGQTAVWNGSEYAFFWFSGPSLVYTRVRADGRPISASVLRTTPNGNIYGPAAVWTGQSYGLVSWDPRGIVLTTVKPAGNHPRDTVITSTQHSLQAAIAWNGSEIAVVWTDLRDGYIALYFARFDVQGKRLGPDVRLTNQNIGSVGAPRLAWGATEYGLAWSDNRDGDYYLRFARLSPSGVQLGGDLSVTALAVLSSPWRLLWMGDAYGIVFTDSTLNLEGDAYFARIGCR